MMTSNATVASAYATRFRTHLVRNLTYLCTQIEQATTTLPEALRHQALHTLSYALAVPPKDLPTIWPVTRKLVLLLAPQMEQAGHRYDWIPYLERTILICIEQQDLPMAAECHLQLGLLYRLLSEFQSAEAELSSSTALFKQVDDKGGAARALNELAWLAHLQRHYGTAERYIKQALTLLADDDPERAMSYRVQGMLATSQQQWQVAEKHHSLALALFQANGDQRRIAWGLQNLAYAYHQQGKYAQALNLYSQAESILRQQGDLYHLAIVLFNQGYCYARCDEAQKALNCYREAEQLFEKLNDKVHKAKLYTEIGLLAFAQAFYQVAEQTFRQSADLFSALDDEVWHINALDGLAMTYLAQQKYKPVRAVLEQAQQLLAVIDRNEYYNILCQSVQRHWEQLLRLEGEIDPIKVTGA